MRKFILPVLLAAAVGFACLPSQAKAAGVSVLVSPGVYVAPTYPYPVYSGYYAPPVYYAPSYYSYGYSSYGYSPNYRHVWHGRGGHGGNGHHHH
jgi:hypothetical protein